MPHKIQTFAGLLFLDEERLLAGIRMPERDDPGSRINRRSRYRTVKPHRRGGDAVEGAGLGRYTRLRRGGRAVECGGLENRYVGNPGVGGSNPPLSALLGYRLQQKPDA